MPDTATLYEQDWYAWTQDQAARLRDLAPSQRPNGLDVEKLAEEVEDLGGSQRRAVMSLMRKVLHRLLKIEFHTPESHRKWKAEVAEFRSQLDAEFRDSPSLRARRDAFAQEVWARAFQDMEDQLANEAPERLALLRATCEEATPHYATDSEVLARNWYPTPRD